jgi:hypothetical protein
MSKGIIITGNKESGKSTLAYGIICRYENPVRVNGRIPVGHFTFSHADIRTDLIIAECTEKYLQQYINLIYGVVVEKRMESPYTIYPDILIIVDDIKFFHDASVPNGYEVYEIKRIKRKEVWI